jgi:very-short-patch-repair endonuclease
MGFKVNPRIGYFAAALAKMPPAEQSLEPHIAALGVRYRCQHGFFNYEYRADFALLDYRLVIEVDDDSHNAPAKRAEDAVRTAKIEAAGWRVVRMTNADALGAPRSSLYKLLRSAGLGDLAGRLKPPTAAPSQEPGPPPNPTAPDDATTQPETPTARVARAIRRGPGGRVA